MKHSLCVVTINTPFVVSIQQREYLDKIKRLVEKVCNLQIQLAEMYQNDIPDRNYWIGLSNVEDIVDYLEVSLRKTDLYKWYTNDADGVSVLTLTINTNDFVKNTPTNSDGRWRKYSWEAAKIGRMYTDFEVIKGILLKMGGKKFHQPDSGSYSHLNDAEKMLFSIEINLKKVSDGTGADGDVRKTDFKFV